jgi:hypothetical protein
MQNLILVALLICMLGAACEDDRQDRKTITIMTGKACGWCGGADSLRITSSKTVYEYRNGCDPTKNKTITETTPEERWDDLITSLNWYDFKDVEVNTCALCADGCDTWILIQIGADSHRIQFTDNSPEVEPIRTFVEKLKAVHEKFRE